MTIDDEIIQGLTVIIPTATTKVYSIFGIGSRLLTSIDINGTGTLSFQSAMETKDYAELDTTLVTDILWEDISISGVPTASITSNVLSESAFCPSLIKIVNTGLVDIKVSLRINRG